MHVYEVIFAYERSGGPSGRKKRRLGTSDQSGWIRWLFFAVLQVTEAFLAGSLLGWGMAGQVI